MKVTSLALDPIEKKPLAAFMPGTRIMSVGSIGCTMRCPWCQNHTIARPRDPHAVPFREISAGELVHEAKSLEPDGNVGIAYTYNEPLLHWKEVLECARLAHEHGLVNVMVTNGVAAHRVIDQLVPYIDAWNIDLKAATQEGYDICGGNIELVKQCIELVARHAHVEVTTLVVPGVNDTDGDFEAIASFVASVDRSIVWHVTRFFPQFEYASCPPTPLSALQRAREIGLRHLDHVILGNI